MSAWVAACALAALPEGRACRLELQGIGVCVLHVEGRVFAVEDRCPHRGARLSGGQVYDGCKVACPDHGWTIDLSTGRVESPDTGQVHALPVEICDGDVLIDLAPLQ